MRSSSTWVWLLHHKSEYLYQVRQVIVDVFQDDYGAANIDWGWPPFYW